MVVASRDIRSAASDRLFAACRPMLLQSGADISVVCRSIPPAGQLEFFETNAIMNTGIRDSRAPDIRGLHLRKDLPLLLCPFQKMQRDQDLAAIDDITQYLPTIFRARTFSYIDMYMTDIGAGRSYKASSVVSGRANCTILNAYCPSISRRLGHSAHFELLC